MREALVVSATLRLWETRDKALIESFVDEVLQLVELDSTRNALVRAVPGLHRHSGVPWLGQGTQHRI